MEEKLHILEEKFREKLKEKFKNETDKIIGENIQKCDELYTLGLEVQHLKAKLLLFNRQLLVLFSSSWNFLFALLNVVVTKEVHVRFFWSQLHYEPF